MNDHSLKIAQRIDTLLREELGEGIDAQRLVDDALYARDVLLVCDAMRGSDLLLYARMFRKAAAAQSVAHPARETAGISALFSSILGPHRVAPAAEPAPPVRGAPPPKPRRWFGRVGSSPK